MCLCTGAFDEFGVMPGDVSLKDGGIQLLYTGWTRPTDYPYETSIGKVFCDIQTEKFDRTTSTLLLGKTESEPYLCNGPMLVINNNVQHLFYASGTGWIDVGEKKESIYKIMHAKSLDGERWLRSAETCLQDRLTNECQNAPTIFFHENFFHMIYCYRYGDNFRNKERGYRLGYAYSTDLDNWFRDDKKLILEGVDEAWEIEMKCYPGVIKVKNKIFMFYCGNNFGQSGFGVAVFQPS